MATLNHLVSESRGMIQHWLTKLGWTEFHSFSEDQGLFLMQAVELAGTGPFRRCSLKKNKAKTL